MNRRPGCLVGLGEFFLFGWLFRWLQRTFGYGRGNAIGCGCGTVILIIAIIVFTSILCRTSWFRLW